MKHMKIHPVFKAAVLSSAAALAAGTITDITTAGQANAAENADKGSLDLKASKGIKSKPNIIYIVLDDIGFADLGCYGSEIKTPNIDRLAADGLRYNNFNACPLSSPTRASLLTGREMNSVGMGNVANMALGPDRPNLQGRISHEAGTVAEILQANGFSTFGVGKWHVAPLYTVTPAGPFDYWPLGKGFQRYYGFMDGETDQYHPQLINGNEVIPFPNTKGYTLNDDILAHASQYITDQVSIYPNKPFFLDYNFGTNHSPQQVPEKYIRTYNGVYNNGWDKIRMERFERQKKLGIIPADTVLAIDSTVKPWNNLSATEKKLFIRFMETYAGFLTQADEEVGKLVNHLKETGQYNNTMIVLIGDNGATSDGGPDGSDFFLSSLGGRVANANGLIKKFNLIGGPEMQALYPKGWAHVSNTPFSTYKSSVYAGALRNPLIITWPAGIKEKGSIRTQYVHVADITATVLDVCKLEAPSVLKGVKQMPMYGISIANTFNNAKAPEVRTDAFFYLTPNGAYYANGWKAISVHKMGTSFDQDVWELYKVSEDYSESRNVAAEYPDIVNKLKAKFMSEAEKYKVLPLKEAGIADFAYVSPDSPSKNTTFKYFPGAGHINVLATPPVGTNSFTITVPVYRANNNVSGVLVAMGDGMGGYTFYIMDNKLVFLYNKWETISSITSNIPVPTGKSVLKFDFKRTSMVNGMGTMYINDKKVGEGELKTAVAMLTFEGLDIGKDTLKPVSTKYKNMGEFPFTGKFDYIQYDITRFIPGPPPGSPGAQKH